MKANALTTYSAVNAAAATGVPQLRIEHLIEVVSSQIERECGRSFGYKQFSTSAPESYYGVPENKLFLKRFPILAVEQVKINGSIVTDWTADAEQLEEGALFRLYGWPRYGLVYADLTADSDPKYQERPITVAYTGGFILPQFSKKVDATNNPDGLAATIPADLEEAAISSVLNLATRGTQPDNLKSETTPGGWSQTFDTSLNLRQVLTNTTLELIEPYRARWFGA